MTTKTALAIADELSAEAMRLRQLAVLYDAAAALLTGDTKLELVSEPPAELAPYGYTRAGKPRKRRPPADPDYARKGWHTRRAAAVAAGQAGSRAERVSMRVLSSTHPTPDELEGREVAHTTEEPAA